MPMQPRGPAPKGRYAKGCRSFLASSVNLEGAEMETSSRNVFLRLIPCFSFTSQKVVISVGLNGQVKGTTDRLCPHGTDSLK